MTPPRRRWSFTLRTLFAAVAIAAVLSAIIRTFPLFALAVAIIVVAAIAGLGVLMLMAGLLWIVTMVLAEGARRIIGPEDSPATHVDQPD